MKNFIKTDLRKGIGTFKEDSKLLMQELYKEVNFNKDIYIEMGSNINGFWGTVTISQFDEMIENMLDNAISTFKEKEVKKYREILTFEIRTCSCSNIENCFNGVDINIYNKQLSLATGTGVSSIKLWLIDEKSLENDFINEINKFNFSNSQKELLFESYDNLSPISKKLTNIDYNLMEDINELLKCEFEGSYTEEDAFNRIYILNLIKQSNLDVSNFIDFVKINEIITDNEKQIEIELFCKENKLSYAKKLAYIQAI